MSGHWLKASRTCPECHIRHEWVPFCPLCGYKYKARVLAETEGLIVHGDEDELPALRKEVLRTKEFFDAHPERDYLMHVAGSAECARYDAKREPRERIAARGPNWRLFVISRKAGEDHFETMYTPFEVRGEFSGKPLDGFGAADDDFSRKYWALLTASIPDVRSAFNLLAYTLPPK